MTSSILWTPIPQDPDPHTPDPHTPDPKTQEVNVNIFHHAVFVISKWWKRSEKIDNRTILLNIILAKGS